jgi:hypothetical protein
LKNKQTKPPAEELKLGMGLNTDEFISEVFNDESSNVWVHYYYYYYSSKNHYLLFDIVLFNLFKQMRQIHEIYVDFKSKLTQNDIRYKTYFHEDFFEKMEYLF